jgi:hypothetical protein
MRGFASSAHPRGHHATGTAINAHVTIRTKEPDVPSNFPPARLFLDDIEEIVRIFREFLETRDMDSSSTVEDLKMKVSFSTEGKESDDLQDLPKIAKSSRELRVSVARGAWPRTSLILHPWLGTFWLQPSGATKEDTWSVFHKLQTLFEKRTRRWSTLLHSLPWWSVSALCLTAAWLPLLLRSSLYKLMPHPAANATILLSYAVIITAAAMGARHTTVIVRHSWEPSPLRQELLQKIPVAAITAVLTFLLTLLGFYLKRKYWP